MKRFALAVLLSSVSTLSVAGDTTCQQGKYDAYIDASLAWYQDLVTLTTEQNPQLAEVSQWFLEGRTHHFELNREAVHYYLVNDPAKVNTNVSVESWLKLEQADIKQLTSRDDTLGKLAKTTFADRQALPHAQNYELRAALADLLSHPNKIDQALSRYNEKVSAVAKTQCD